MGVRHERWILMMLADCNVGSAGNVDSDSHCSRIRRLNLTGSNCPLDFQKGEVFADGLRNEVGLAFDRHGVRWGVENGADNLFRSDLGGDIHNDNPAEELHRFPDLWLDPIGDTPSAGQIINCRRL